MWKRKELKKRAKEVVRKNSWTAIVVCFIIALLTGDFGTSIVGIWQADDSIDPNYIVNSQTIIMNNEIARNKSQNGEFLFNINDVKDSLSNTQLQIFEAV